MGESFDVSDVPRFGRLLQHVSGALGQLKDCGFIKIVDKQAQRYVYEVVTLDDSEHRWHDYFPRDNSHRKIGTPHKVLTKNEIAGTVTGRMSHTEPEMQDVHVHGRTGEGHTRFVPPDSVALSADFNVLETRVLAHIAGLQEELPKAMHHLEVSLKQARVSLLDCYSDLELMQELSRRLESK